MRWTLGLVGFATACFGEPASPTNTSADDTTTGTPTATDASASSSESTTATTTSSADTESSGPPDVTESSGADTTAGEMCGMGSVPNPPPPPRGWSVVFVSSPAPELPGCPPGSDLLAVGNYGIPAKIDTCDCRCDAPFHELCTLIYTNAATCPANGGDQQLDVECQPLPDDQSGFLGDASGSTCAPQPVTPTSDLVQVCAAQESEGPCIDQPDGLIGPCLFQEGVVMGGCPMGLEQLDVGHVPLCGNCAASCPIAAHCGSAEFDVWTADDCTGDHITFSDDQCYETPRSAGSISAHPTLPQACGTVGLSFQELTVCCPM